MANPPSANRFKAVFFDLDGTIVDIHGPLFNAARAALQQIGHASPLTRERYRDAIASGDFYLGLPDDRRDAYMRLAYLNLALEVERIDAPAVLAQVPETLAELKRREYATAIITSRPGDAARLTEKLARVGLAQYFDQIITQSSFSMRALDKSASLADAAARAGVAPRQCVYVGDEPRDMMAAINAGYGARVAVATGPATHNQLAAHPEYPPHFVMRTMGELVELLAKLEHAPPE